MRLQNVRRGVAGLGTAVLVSLLVAGMKPARDEGRPAEAAKARPAGKLVAMPKQLAGLEITLGLKDEKATPWGGEIQLSGGKLLEAEVVRGGPKMVATGSKWNARTVQQKQGMKQVLVRPVVRVALADAGKSEVTVKTKQGNFRFKLADVPLHGRKTFLDDQVAVTRDSGAVRLTGPETEDDYPALARGADGTVWLAYVEYQPGQTPLRERVHAGEFDDLVPKGNGDCVRLVRFDGKVWHPPEDVTATGLNVWRPALAVDGKGVLHVVWSQHDPSGARGDWELFCRRWTPAGDGSAKGTWSKVERLTNAAGADVNVVAATDSAGTVWLAWQAWRDGNFDIQAMALAEGHDWSKPQTVSDSKANDWSPAIACDGTGNVYVAWDTYDKGNYDVRLRRIGKKPGTWTVAGSARFEARPSLACDAGGRVWIAYEEGDEQWGKDFASAQFKRIGLKGNLGNALYLKRTVRVKCLVDDKIQQPAAGPEKAFPEKPKVNKSLPRLAIGKDGGVWLLLRHHPWPGGNGEVWKSYALHYDGTRWAGPMALAGSLNLLDNRPALLPLGEGLLAVCSGDGRKNTTNRGQTDLFATLLAAPGPAGAPELAPDDLPSEPALKPVHANDSADVARIRAHRVEVGGKKLRLLRGEFHRHTEYSSHRDGDGLLEDSYRYALDAGALDWMGNGDHDNGYGSEYMWWQIQKTFDVFHHPPTFVAAVTYERSVVYPNGHRNVMMPKCGIRPLMRGDLKGTAEKGTPDTKVLYLYLKHFGGICSSHTSATGMGTDWRDNNPELEPVVEIYQGHRHNYEHPEAPRSPTKATEIGGYEPAGYVWNALEKGYRLGFQSSSDHVSTHMSYAVVLTDDASRQGLIDAFKKRHSYAATDNIILVVRSGEQLMGDVFTTAKRPSLQITVRGTAPLAKVHVIRNNRYVYSTEPKKPEATLLYTDMDAREGQTSYYYVRVEQADGNLAWGSPMWITYKP
jgi:hypothetical protein